MAEENGNSAKNGRGYYYAIGTLVVLLGMAVASSTLLDGYTNAKLKPFEVEKQLRSEYDKKFEEQESRHQANERQFREEILKQVNALITEKHGNLEEQFHRNRANFESHEKLDGHPISIERLRAIGADATRIEQRAIERSSETESKDRALMAEIGKLRSDLEARIAKIESEWAARKKEN